MSRRKVNLELLKGSTNTERPLDGSAGATGVPSGTVERDYPTEILEMTKGGNDVHFITGGKWSMYDLLERALQVTGPAELWLSTFSITETSARMIAGHQDAGRITALHMLVDYRAKLRYPQVYQLASNIATRIRLTPVHAKVMVLHGTDATITVVGSANWTENPRIEAGVMTRNVGIAAFHLSWLNQSIENGNPFN